MLVEDTTVTVEKQINEDERIQAMGAAIRARRHELGLSLRDVSKQSGLSIGFLSLVERGLSSLALTSLSNIAKALDIELSVFFPREDEQKRLMVAEETAAKTKEGGEKSEPTNSNAYICRADDQSQLAIISSQRVYKMLSPRVPGLTLEPIFVTIQPGDTKDEPYGHDGEEFVYTLSGELVFVIEENMYRLGPGDSIHFRSSVSHTIRNETDQPVQALWVLTPRIM